MQSDIQDASEWDALLLQWHHLYFDFLYKQTDIYQAMAPHLYVTLLT